jgi:SPP1 family predicted phage head-tail adaptor
MAINKLIPANFSKRVEFGINKMVHNSNTGVNISKFETKISCWCMPYTRSIYQQISLTPEQLDEPVIVVRHNAKISPEMLVKYNDIQYIITNISADDSNTTIAYDYITLRKKGK